MAKRRRLLLNPFCILAASVVLGIGIFFFGFKNNADQKPLMEFLDAYENAVKFNPGLQEGKTTEERAIRARAKIHRNDVRVIDEFLSSHPELSERAKSAILDLREVCAEQSDFFNAMVSENRFERTEAEKERDHHLRDLFQLRLRQIGNMSDGR